MTFVWNKFKMLVVSCENVRSIEKSLVVRELVLGENVSIDANYRLIFFFVLLSIGLSAVLLLVVYPMTYKKQDDFEKLSAYECGFDPFSSGFGVFEVHFYVIGVLFIIFDLEIIFLYPWALNLGFLGFSGLIPVFFFLFILTLGFVYE